jgi:2-polyprenyl-3-methyl-5-hydroxy-6-metoxy-1,4-benzoquinol methylase
MKISKHYLGKEGEEYFREHCEIRAPFENYLGDILNAEKFLPFIPNGSRVLDFGCGSGGMLSVLQSRGYKAEGLEYNPAAVRVARNAGLTVCDSFGMLPELSFDVITSNHVLEHIENPTETLRALRRLLRPGGILLLKLPIDDFRSADQKNWKETDTDHHLQTWTPLSLGNTLLEAEYVVRKVEVINWAWHPRLFWLLKTFLKPTILWILAVVLKRRQLFAIAERSV